MLLFIRSPVHLIACCPALPCTRAQCGCMDNPLVLKTLSTGAEVAGIQKIFSNSLCKSANSFFYLTRRPSQSSLSSSLRFRRIVIVIIILCLQKFQDLSLRTGTCKLVLDDPRWRGHSSGTTTLSLVPCHCPWDLLRCVTYYVIFTRATLC